MDVLGHRTNFAVPGKTFDLGALGKAHFSVNEVHSNPDYEIRLPGGVQRMGKNYTVSTSGASYKLQIRFESWGKELHGWHTGSVVSLGDNAVPDVDIDDLKVNVLLDPTTSNGRPTFTNIRATVSANISTTLQLPLVGNVRIDLNRFTGDVKDLIAQQVTSKLNTSDVKNQLKTALWNALVNTARSASNRAVVDSARWDGLDLVVSFHIN